MPFRDFTFEKDTYYHVTAHSCTPETLFVDERDRERFYGNMERFSAKYQVEIKAFVVMGNHYHMLVRQLGEYSISDFMKAFNGGYAKYFNLRHNRSGILFKSRFHARPIEDAADFCNMTMYVHNNPVEAGITKRAEDYPYSSMSDFCGPAIWEELYEESGDRRYLRMHSKRNPERSYAKLTYRRYLKKQQRREAERIAADEERRARNRSDVLREADRIGREARAAALARAHKRCS